MVTLCESHCLQYLQYLTDRCVGENWATLWPAVLATLLRRSNDVARYLWSVLPDTMRKQYATTLACEFSNVPLDASRQITDRTHDILLFKSQHKSLNLEEVIAAVDQFSFPSVICPCGSWLFLEECHPLPFHLYLNFLQCQLKSYPSGIGQFKGMRNDYMDSSCFLESFNASASTVLDDQRGLCMLVCALHSHGLPLKYVHPPKHPINGFVSSVHDDRLTAVVSSMRVARSAKAEHSSFEFRLLKMNGDNRGTHVLSLSQGRKMVLQNWETVLYSSEMLAIQFRPDVRAFAKQLILDGIMSDEYFLQLTDKNTSLVILICRLPNM